MVARIAEPPWLPPSAAALLGGPAEKPAGKKVEREPKLVHENRQPSKRSLPDKTGGGSSTQNAMSQNNQQRIVAVAICTHVTFIYQQQK